MTITSVTQQNDRKGFLESGLIVTVDYDADKDLVDHILTVKVRNYKTGTMTDITAILFDMFSDGLQAILTEIKWKTLIPEQPLIPTQ